MYAIINRLVLIAAVALSGCAANVTKPAGSQQSLELQGKPTAVALLITGNANTQASQDWQTFRAEWRTAFASVAAGAGLPFSYHETDVIDAAAGTVLVKMTVNDYRYLTSGARYGLGIMTGNAFIDADAEFVALPARKSVGSRKYATSSSAWEGVFSAMTDKQVLAISNEIIQELTKK